MYELSCPSCNSASQYETRDFLLMCPFCSTTFRMDIESGQKEVFGDHYIIANSASPGQVKDLVSEWLKRLHHRPGQTDKEYFVVDIHGLSIPYWVISMEAHTAWKGLVSRRYRPKLDHAPGSDFLIERGQFRRNYRWAISARNNLCETWGLTRLHEPKEDIKVAWDGFPLDSTMSRGQINSNDDARNAYDTREFFDFKFANGMPVLGIQVSEEEALRRARTHVDLYHMELARQNVDHLVDIRNELEVAGIQLIHLPFWHARYVYRPRTALRYFYKSKEKNVIIEGFNNGVLKGELAIHYREKVWVNAIVTAFTALLMVLLGALWHPAFFLVAAFAAVISIASAYMTASRKQKDEETPEGQTKIEAEGSAA